MSLCNFLGAKLLQKIETNVGVFCKKRGQILIHIPGAWPDPSLQDKECPRHTTQTFATIFCNESYAAKLWNDFRIVANAMINNMLV